MDGIQEGGVHTQKVSVTMGVIALLMLGAFVCCVFVADDSAAETTVNVQPETDFCGVNTSLSAEDAIKVKYVLTGDDDYYFEATLKDSSGKTAGSLDKSSGTLSGTTTYTSTVTVTAPITSGDFNFTVKFYESTQKSELLAEKTVPLKVVDPVTLSFTLKNEGSASVDVTVYFKVNGVKMDDSEQTVTVSAGGTQDVSYKYFTKDVSDTTYSLESDQKIINQSIKGLGEEKTFYAHDSDYTVITWIAVVVLIIMVVVMIFIYRKPVINKGKPRGRR